LTPEEARVVGCLMEKSAVTPEQYPLTLNALTNACNQKSAREPMMALTQGEVQRAARNLKDKHLVEIDENFRSGVEKYKQRLCNTTFSDLQLDSAGFAILTLLLLRGPQTPGELRARSGRLHSFADNTDVVNALGALVGEGDDALAVKLPRMPGRKDAEYMHQLCGPVDIEAHASRAAAARTTDTSGRASVVELAHRVERLEAEVAALKAQLQGTAQ
jgi:hypothetical protein